MLGVSRAGSRLKCCDGWRSGPVWAGGAAAKIAGVFVDRKDGKSVGGPLFPLVVGGRGRLVSSEPQRVGWSL